MRGYVFVRKWLSCMCGQTCVVCTQSSGVMGTRSTCVARAVATDAGHSNVRMIENELTSVIWNTGSVRECVRLDGILAECAYAYVLVRSRLNSKSEK